MKETKISAWSSYQAGQIWKRYGAVFEAFLFFGGWNVFFSDVSEDKGREHGSSGRFLLWGAAFRQADQTKVYSVQVQFLSGEFLNSKLNKVFHFYILHSKNYIKRFSIYPPIYFIKIFWIII